MNENDFRQRVEFILLSLKTEKKTEIPGKQEIPLSNTNNLLMYVITEKMLQSKETIQFLAEWRKKSNKWFPAQFVVTFQGTQKWAIDQLLHKTDRILFFLKIKNDKQPFGHIGLYRFNFEEKSCEIDNVIRGVEKKASKGGMTVGLSALIAWTFRYLGIRRIYLQVFSDNKKAIALYAHLGFRELERTPLVEKKENGVVSWIEASREDKNIKRYFVRMYLDN